MRAAPLYPEELAELLQTAKAGVTSALELWATDANDTVYQDLAARSLRQYAQANFKLTQLCEDGEGDQAEQHLAKGMQAHSLAERIAEGLVSPQEALEFGRQRRAVEPGRLQKARSLTVYPAGGESYTVTGSSEPHTASLEGCDCADFRYGNLCKHVLAVHRHRGIPLEADQTVLVEPLPNLED